MSVSSLPPLPSLGASGPQFVSPLFRQSFESSVPSQVCLGPQPSGWTCGGAASAGVYESQFFFSTPRWSVLERGPWEPNSEYDFAMLDLSLALELIPGVAS